MTQLLLVVLSVATLAVADATGTWTGTLTPSDGQSGPAHLVLKQDGDKLTGTAGPDDANQNAIQNAKIEKGTITFELVLPGGTMKFRLKQEGEKITGDVTRERDGKTDTAKLAVKRAK